MLPEKGITRRRKKKKKIGIVDLVCIEGSRDQLEKR